MLRVTVRGGGLRRTVLGSGETLLVGRAPATVLAESDAVDQLRHTTLELPDAAAHVSRVVAEVVVGEEVVRLRWHGSTEAQLSSLFDAPGGARRVALGTGMSALLDEGENQLLLLRGRADAGGSFSDLTLDIEVDQPAPDEQPPPPPLPRPVDATATAPAPGLEPWSKEWFVALALAEPWLTGLDDYPRPPSNREIYERVREWHGYAWNLERPQRVDESIRAVAALAFGAGDDPFTTGTGRVQNVRYAVGLRAAETRLVTAADLAGVRAKAAARGFKES
ncbi:hypothetical protein SAMN04489867_1793 [Pedococcus dokdonensis]|uniref:Uncharacterized protein n=1 Tax=Pedococcus dokdonensis TaxID=443156 RepID=A0A1H0R173_9MICO|nr:hypothetical protein [Pedococcus dokdonensis]SDP22776.1 hypothetical protein SAMN04489867_1793 [Pedococcus dokdonensis]